MEKNKGMSPKRMEVIERVDLEVLGLVGMGRGVMKNISRTGALIAVYEEDYTPQKGEIIRVESNLIDSFAEVVWTKNNRAGICFLPESQAEERVMMRRTAFGLE